MAKQRQVRVEQKSAMAAMSALELRSDEELAAETKHRAAAQAILGARASERYDAAKAREHFRKAIAASRPQERMQLRRMAEASLALAERRPDDLKAAVEKMGQTGAVQPPALRAAAHGPHLPRRQGASRLMKVRGGLILFAIVVALLTIGFGIANLVLLPFGGGSTYRRVRPRAARRHRRAGGARAVRPAQAGQGASEGANAPRAGAA